MDCILWIGSSALCQYKATNILSQSSIEKNPASYNLSAGSIEQVLAYTDNLLAIVIEDWNQTTNYAALRCPPMIFPLPKGQKSHAAEFAVILKMDDDGDTVVYSPVPLPHLENQ